MKRKSQRGIALVITLIMLALVTLMAVLFLGVSRRERASVTVTSSLTDAKLAAETGQARALAEVITRITAQSNRFAYDFLVSTNFITSTGFRPNLASLTNVSYVYAGSGLSLNSDKDIRQNQANLFYDPRPPVFVVTNLATGASDFRFYLDLNRNRRFDTNGYQRVLNTNGVFTGETGFYWGDPEWIGILEHPDLPHSPSNRFIARYAYVVVPAGKTLDINYVHNNARNPGSARPSPLAFSFCRNQGAGSWEINLAAFLRELNTNVWNYSYTPGTLPNSVFTSRGSAFRDALSILTNRYAGLWSSLRTVNQTFGSQIGNLFRSDQIDEYSDGPLMIDIKPSLEGGVADDPNKHWSGSYNTNGYSSVQELFDPTKTSALFVRLLTNSIAGKGTYDQNTFYRLMSQLGTDSLPANRLTGSQLAQLGLPGSTIVGKLNLNYDNVNTNTGAIDPSLTTNFVGWTPIRFFTNAADLMLRTVPSRSGATLAIANISIYPTNEYSPGVHRLLQLAANIGDAATNRVLLASTNNMNYYAPSVFRPLFKVDGPNIAISGYEEVTNNVVSALAQQWVDLTVPTNSPASSAAFQAVQRNPRVNIYGVPWVIGAKKGLPNFNEYMLRSSVQVTRRLQVTKDRGTTPTFQQAYEIGVSNYFALEAWNSYTQACPFAVDVILTNRASLALTHSDPRSPSLELPLYATNVVTTNNLNIPTPMWTGKGTAGEFQIPLKHLEILVPDEEYHFSAPYLRPIQTSISFDNSRNFPVPNWKLHITNRVVFALVAKDVVGTTRLVDFVNLDNLGGGMDISRALVGSTNAFGDEANDRSGMFWQTNRIGSGAGNKYSAPPNATGGITNQLYVSLTNALSDRDWNSYSKSPIDGRQREKAIDDFRKFMGLPPMFNLADTNIPPGRVFQVPFTPTRKLDQQLSWQVNDPLVHYTLADLYDPFYADTNNVQALLPGQTAPLKYIGQRNDRYRPWGGKPGKDPSDNASARNLAIKDPLITQSDDWDFPTNKFPNLGWLGRVHRGTPWQTVYLKAPVEPIQTWVKWAGLGQIDSFGQVRGHPTNDWHLVGLFTTAVNDNAARGLLSVNQTNVAAWSAVLSGVSVLTNALTTARPGAIPVYSNLFIEPASWQVHAVVTNINARRLQQPGQVFADLGSVLAAETLSVASPYLNTANNQGISGIRDEVYERIPQQILSLLKEDEPYVVIYAFGQSLRPAENSIVRAPGPYRGLCTNYEVTGEMATKTVVRIEEIRQEKPQRKLLGYKSIVESYNVLPSD